MMPFVSNWLTKSFSSDSVLRPGYLAFCQFGFKASRPFHAASIVSAQTAMPLWIGTTALDAGHRLGSVLVKGSEVGPVGRRPRDGGIEHARHKGIDPELRQAVHLVMHVEPRHIFADVPELAFLFEHGILRNFQLCRFFREAGRR